MAILFGGPTPQDGKSAYQVAVLNGFQGTEQQWLASLKGEDGDSAYQVAVQGGFNGTYQQWLASLKGEDGDSAYQVWLKAGHSGTEAQFLAWLQANTDTVGILRTWDMGLGTPDAQNISVGTGQYIQIGGLVTCHGSIALEGAAESGKVRLPKSCRFGLSSFPIHIHDTNFLVNFKAKVLANTSSMSISRVGGAQNQGLQINFSFSYLTSYIPPVQGNPIFVPIN